MKSKVIQWTAGGLAILFLALFPLVLRGSPYYITVMTSALFYAVLSSNWAFLAGIAGQFSFAHLALVGLGAYTSGLLCHYFGISPLYGILAGTAMAGVVGFGVGVLCLRLRGAYLALFTIAFSEIVRIIILTEHQFTGGNRGLRMPPLYQGATHMGKYYIILALFLVMLGSLWWLAKSRFGMFVRAMREDDEAASALGVNLVHYKVLIFTITSAMVGLAGAVFYHQIGIATPEIMKLLQMSLVIAFAIIGGLESLIGAAVGAVLGRVFMELLRGFTIFGVEIQFGVWRYAVFGVLLILTLRFAQNGLLYPIIDRLLLRPARQATMAKRTKKRKGS